MQSAVDRLNVKEGGIVTGCFGDTRKHQWEIVWEEVAGERVVNRESIDKEVSGVVVFVEERREK
jgi:hypothetical protein